MATKNTRRATKTEAEMSPEERMEESLTAALREASSFSSWEQSVSAQTETVFGAIQRNLVLNFLVRIGLYALAIVGFGLAVYWVADRGDTMVQVLLDDGNFNEARLLALVIPVALAAFLALAALGAALLLQRRGVADFTSGISSVSRLRREAQAGISRPQALSHVLEDIVENTRTAFRIKMSFIWTLFSVSVIVFITAVIEALVNGELNATNGVMLVSSIGGAAFSVSKGSADEVGEELAEMTQVQLLVAHTARQTNVIEELLYKTLEAHKRDPAAAAGIVAKGVQQISVLTEATVNRLGALGEEADEEERVAEEERADEEQVAEEERAADDVAAEEERAVAADGNPPTRRFAEPASDPNGATTPR